MPKLINLRPIQTGDACYLQDHHNREGECVITVVMNGACYSADYAQMAIISELADRAEIASTPVCWRDLFSVMRWCAEQWQLAQADMPPETDRDTEGQDEDRYLECHILATWEA